MCQPLGGALLSGTKCSELVRGGYSLSVPSLEVREKLRVPPSEDEVLAVMSTLKSGKAGGKNGVFPEMLKCCGANLLDYLIELFNQVWKDGCVTQE